MKPGDADRLADFMETIGMPLVPWQRHWLGQLETAAVRHAFTEIVGRL